ncbi:hypothetical protein AGR13a_Cc170260 [Agrobacterium genomosp. 13 str. CFBP 6927]|uniref:Secreted protein n=1 Tax=Agrobacterium genomosp. 13 str. CFBP 6927 TaxID=1183428 RepID=A0ABM9VBV2_9HYPH|nr:hypothetical protein AGR13a_Cc170260 [Agrobacterium genomosp. 13 str. CFBP 6927]
MIMFIGWWQETGLALLQCALRSAAVSALHHPKTPPCRSRKGFLLHHLGGLPNGRPRDYVQFTSGPMDRYATNGAPALACMQRMRRPEGVSGQWQDPAQCQWPQAGCLAYL